MSADRNQILVRPRSQAQLATTGRNRLLETAKPPSIEQPIDCVDGGVRYETTVHSLINCSHRRVGTSGFGSCQRSQSL